MVHFLSMKRNVIYREHTNAPIYSRKLENISESQCHIASAMAMGQNGIVTAKIDDEMYIGIAKDQLKPYKN